MQLEEALADNGYGRSEVQFDKSNSSSDNYLAVKQYGFLYLNHDQDI